MSLQEDPVVESKSTNVGNQKLTEHNHPPRVWQIPIEIRRRLSGRVGRQRAIAFEDHLLMVLHRVPDRRTPRQAGVYFWRSPAGEWSYSEQGAGFAALQRLVDEYESTVVQLEQTNETAIATKDWFAILERVGPIHRASRNLHSVLTQAVEETNADQQRLELQALCDQASEIERSAELLQTDVQNTIQYSMARQSELQAGFGRAQSRAAHRLNVLAAIFLPLATVSSVFGMNLMSGVESVPFVFWLVLSIGLVLGICIGIFVMDIKALNPDEW